MKFNQLLASTAIVMSLTVAQNALAHTSAVREFTCPIGGETFQYHIDTSGTSFGMMTDMRPVGPIAAPFAIPQCPSNKFVMFKHEFTPAELAKFEKAIKTEEYQQIAKESTTYFAWGRMMELANENQDDQQMMQIFLQSSWQRGNEASLKKTLEYADKALAKSSFQNADGKLTVQFLRGEMLRKLQRFDEAKAWFETLQKNPDVKKNKTLKQLAAFQLQLIEKKDSNSHHIDFK